MKTFELEYYALKINGVAASTDLLSQQEVSVHRHGVAGGDEVRDGFHDVPTVLPPGQSRQDTVLGGHDHHAGDERCLGADNRLAFTVVANL